MVIKGGRTPHSNKNHQLQIMRIAISTEKILNYVISQPTGGCAGKIRAVAALCIKSLQSNSSVNTSRCVFSEMASFSWSAINGYLRRSFKRS